MDRNSTLRARNEEVSAPASIPDSNAEKAAFVARLQIILSHWPSADRLARNMGASPSAFRKWLKGEAEPSRGRLVALAHAAGVGVAWLAEGAGPEPTFEPEAGARRRRPVGREAVTGTAWNDPVPWAGPSKGPQPIAPYQEWIRATLGMDPAHVMVEIASGDAMAPTIRDGDMLLIATGTRSTAGNGMYLLKIGDQREVKRVQRKHDGGLLLISDNRAYHPETIDKTEADRIAVIGRVVWAGGPV